MIDSFMANRPASDPAFWNGLVEILRRTSSVVFWMDSGAVVANAAVIAHYPKDFIEALGVPTVVTNGEDIIKCIKNSG